MTRRGRDPAMGGGRSQTQASLGYILRPCLKRKQQQQEAESRGHSHGCSQAPSSVHTNKPTFGEDAQPCTFKQARLLPQKSLAQLRKKGAHMGRLSCFYRPWPLAQERPGTEGGSLEPQEPQEA